MSRFDEILNGMMPDPDQNPGGETEGRTLADLWERLRRMEPAQIAVAAPLLFATAGIAVLGLLAAAIFGAAAVILLDALLGDSKPKMRPGFTYH